MSFKRSLTLLLLKRLHHAYLFTGTRGVGKTTVSRILAKSLNCLGTDGAGGITASPCGVCEACSAIDAGRFIDYTELDAASNRGVDEMQQLLEQAVYKPVQGRFKVFMIDEVHMLTNTAFNSMLKTLEEPPEYLKFVLATTDPQKVPVTVLSRCLQFNLRPMAPQTVREHLSHVLAQENIAAEPAALRLLATSAHGSMRDALSLTDQAIAFGAGALTESQVRQMLGSVDDAYVLGLIEALANNDGKLLIERIEALRVAGLNVASTLEQMTDVLHRMAVFQALETQPLTTTSGDEDNEAIRALSKQLPADETQLLYSICLHGRADLGLAADSYAALTMILLRLLAFKPTANTAEDAVAPSKKPEIASPMALPVRIQSEPVVKVEKPKVETVVNSGLGDAWFECVKKLLNAEAVTALARELALQAQLIAQTESQWTLQVESSVLMAPQHVEKLQNALSDSGVNVILLTQVGVVTDNPAKRIAAAARQQQYDAEQAILNDPEVKRLIQDFGGKIVQGSIKPIAA